MSKDRRKMNIRKKTNISKRTIPALRMKLEERLNLFFPCFSRASFFRSSFISHSSSSWSFHAGNIFIIWKNMKSGAAITKQSCLKMQLQQTYNMGSLVSFGKLFIYAAREGKTPCLLDWVFICLCCSTRLYKYFYITPFFFRRQILFNATFA